MDEHSSRRYLLRIRFDGSEYCGWQRQKEDVQSTVEQHVEQALEKLFNTTGLDVVGHGRTDAGVHALDQCAHVDLPDCFLPFKIKKALNSLLPTDIRIHAVQAIKADAHARFDALSRSYAYPISLVENPLIRKYSLHYGYILDVKKMQEAVQVFMGEHDFAAFAIQLDEQLPHTRCLVHSCRFTLDKTKEQLIFQITANRFLRRMVRRVVGSLLMLGRGKYKVDDIQHWLDSAKAPIPDIYTAPAYPLRLEKVEYPTDIFE